MRSMSQTRRKACAGWLAMIGAATGLEAVRRRGVMRYVFTDR